jgi:hypothetical protein
VKFLKDQWFGSCSLAIQYWDIYSIINEQACTVSEAWDGMNLEFTFRRSVDSNTMNHWYELLQIAGGCHLTEVEDVIIWRSNPFMQW